MTEIIPHKSWRIPIKLAFYICGILIASLVVALPEIFSTVERTPEIGPLLFNFVWVFIPFAVLPSIVVPSRRTILSTVLVTVAFWTLVLFARGSKDGVNFGLSLFFLFFYPFSIVIAVLGIERLMRSRVR
jgi:hypothetical protein